MKASELMIGDYIASELGKIYRVKGVRDWDGGEVLVSTGKADMWYEYGLIKPIPITEEVLRANGFSRIGKDGMTVLKIEEERKEIRAMFCFIEIRSTSHHETMIKLHSTQFYVHEFQHALRLCGLTELANNFKI